MLQREKSDQARAGLVRHDREIQRGHHAEVSQELKGPADGRARPLGVGTARARPVLEDLDLALNIVESRCEGTRCFLVHLTFAIGPQDVVQQRAALHGERWSTRTFVKPLKPA